MRRDRPLPYRHDLLLIQHRNLRIGVDLRALLLFAAAHLPQANLVTRIGRELRADEVANPRPDAMLPGVKFFQPGMRLLGHGRPLAAEVVQLLHLAEELHRVVHAIDAKLQLLHVVRIDRDLRLLAGQIGALAGEREPRFGVGVLLRHQRQHNRMSGEEGP